jgi:hypothetical protein
MDMTTVPESRVRSLNYSVQCSLNFTPTPIYPANFGGEGFPDVAPRPVDFERQGVKFHLEAGRLLCEIKTHFPTVEEARAVVDPILRAWELKSELEIGRNGLRFDFGCADLELSGVGNDGSCIVQPASAVAATAISGVSVHVSGEYPQPPAETFRVGPDVEDVLFHYHNYLDGREQFLAMAYKCLTIIEEKGGNSRQHAADMYRIDKPVLDLIGKLSSTRGDRRTGRKAKTRGPLTSMESEWLHAALRKLIERLADMRPSAELEWIRKSDLPPV